MDTCMACGREIIFIRRRDKWKQVPCDPTPIPFHMDAHGKERVLTKDGKMVFGYGAFTDAEVTDIGYEPHLITCPERKKLEEMMHPERRA